MRFRPFNTVTFRLTAWHLLLFTLVSAAIMALAEARLDAILRARTDHDLEEDLLELRGDFAAAGLGKLQEDFDREAKSNGPDAIVLALVSPAGEIRASSDLAPWAWLQLPPPEATGLPPGDVGFISLVPPGQDERVRVALLRLADGQLLLLGHPLREEDEMTEIFHSVLLLALFGMLVTGCVMAWLITRTAMKGVARVKSMASTMGRDRLGERVVVGHEGQEITDLAVAFNGMLERIDALVHSLREVTDNLAHDLRGPLTRLRGTAETTLTSDADISEYKELAATVVEETDALVALINTMLEIAQTDAGRLSLETTTIEVGALLAESHELFRPAAEDCGLRLNLALSADQLIIRSDRARLQRVLANLLDNAIKYTPANGSVTLSARRVDQRIAIAVEDTGIGINELDRARIFDRFFRADISRSQPGNGLGLSLCEALVRVLGGEITVESELGQGSLFTVWLPMDASAGR